MRLGPTPQALSLPGSAFLNRLAVGPASLRPLARAAGARSYRAAVFADSRRTFVSSTGCDA